jgi:hypothetical protein
MRSRACANPRLVEEERTNVRAIDFLPCVHKGLLVPEWLVATSLNFQPRAALTPLKAVPEIVWKVSK